MKRVIVIGAGIGGLTTAAALSRFGFDVHVLEAQVIPGGCAGTFYHKGYRFDAGATLAGGFFPGGPMDQIAETVGIKNWPVRTADPAMVVHLPDGQQVVRWGDERRYEEYRSAFGEAAERFFGWQEKTADAMWAFASMLPAWPPTSIQDWIELLTKGAHWLRDGFPDRLSADLIADFFRPVRTHLEGSPEKLRLFTDAQLLISAQTTSEKANALYGASALDLPRRGVVHVKGGVGAIAETLVNAIRANGGRVSFRRTVSQILIKNGRPMGVRVERGGVLPAEIVIANLTPWNLVKLLDHVPSRLMNLPVRPVSGWGAFMAYVGFEEGVLPDNFPLHHQLIIREPLGEGNSLFVSISPEWDQSRAPGGKRAMTISTHTNYHRWWELYKKDLLAYEDRKQEYLKLILARVENALPGLQQAADLVLPGTPLTFERYTKRALGWVGGFPQIDLTHVYGPRVLPNLWMVGDSIFPGQSIASVGLGGLRVATNIKIAHKLKKTITLAAKITTSDN